MATIFFPHTLPFQKDPAILSLGRSVSPTWSQPLCSQPPGLHNGSYSPWWTRRLGLSRSVNCMPWRRNRAWNGGLDKQGLGCYFLLHASWSREKWSLEKSQKIVQTQKTRYHEYLVSEITVSDPNSPVPRMRLGYHSLGFHWIPSKKFLIVDAGLFKPVLMEFLSFAANKPYWFIKIFYLNV